MVASRKEVTAAKRLMRESLTPLQKYENAQKKLANLRSKNVINDQAFQAGLAKEKRLYEDLIGVTARRQRAEQLMNQQRERARQVIDSLKTKEQRLAEQTRELDRLHRRGLITLDQRNRKLKQMQREVRGLTLAEKARAAITSRLAVGLRAASLAGATIAVARNASRQFQEVDRLAKFARQVDFPIEKLTKFQFVAAETSSVTDQTFNMAMQRMVRRTSEAANGTGEAVSALREMRFNAKLLNQLKPDQRFLMIADALKAVGNQSDRNRLAMKLFDSEGVKLVNTLQLGSKEILRQSQRAAQLGLVVNEIDAGNIERANDAVYEMQRAWAGVGRTIAKDVAPILTKVMSLTADVIKGTNLRATTPFGILGNAAIRPADSLAPIKERAELEKARNALIKRENSLIRSRHAQFRKQITNELREFFRVDEFVSDFNRRLTQARKGPELLTGFQNFGREFARNFILNIPNLEPPKTNRPVSQRRRFDAVPDSIQSGSAEAFRLLNRTRAAADPALTAQQKTATATEQMSEKMDRMVELLENLGLQADPFDSPFSEP